jgi:hypothetical protein
MHDPVGWAKDRIGVDLWSKQREIMRSVVTHRKTAVQSAHATGKSFNASVLSSWWVDVHPPGEALVVTTAPTREQVHSILWEEIRKIHRNGRLPGEVQRSDRWILADGTQVGIGRKPADHMQSAFQGLHKKYVLVIMDEAGGIPQWLWDAAGAITTGPECRILAIGNPDDNASQFYKVCTQDQAWNHMKISAFDTPYFTGERVPKHVIENLVEAAYVEDSRLSWGENSALYRCKVLGEFSDSDDGLIPMSWVTAANRRWELWKESKDKRESGNTIFGVDVARGGEDKTVISTRKGKVIIEIEAFVGKNTIEVANLVEARMDKGHVDPLAVVDGIGIGAGVVDLLGAHGYGVYPFIASAGTDRRDANGMQRFPNVRSAAWWNMRELLDPARDAVICLPPHDQLTADLTAPSFKSLTGGKIQVESKDDIKKRLGRSTDYGDSVVQAFWTNGVPLTREEDVVIRPVAYTDSMFADSLSSAW